MEYEYFMETALDKARQALSLGEFPVGCVIVYEERVVATGYRKKTAGNCINEIDHAEMVALRDFADFKESIDNKKTTLFCTLEPCLMCLGAIILTGISKIVYAYEDIMGGGTQCDLTTLSPLYKEHQISMVPNILRKKSIALLKTFFNNPENNYWKGSLLAEYTLNQ